MLVIHYFLLNICIPVPSDLPSPTFMKHLVCKYQLYLYYNLILKPCKVAVIPFPLQPFQSYSRVTNHTFGHAHGTCAHTGSYHFWLMQNIRLSHLQLYTKYGRDQPGRYWVIARGLFSTPTQSARATCYSDHVDMSALVTLLVGGMGLSNKEDG